MKKVKETYTYELFASDEVEYSLIHRIILYTKFEK